MADRSITSPDHLIVPKIIMGGRFMRRSMGLYIVFNFLIEQLKNSLLFNITKKNIIDL